MLCCHVVHLGVEVSPTYLATGIKFSWPTYKSGLRVMIHATLQTGSTWAFASIFAWQVRSRCKALSVEELRAGLGQSGFCSRQTTCFNLKQTPERRLASNTAQLTDWAFVMAALMLHAGVVAACWYHNCSRAGGCAPGVDEWEVQTRRCGSLLGVYPLMSGSEATANRWL